MSTDMIRPDILNDLFPEAQAAIATRIDEILDACAVKDFDRLTTYHLAGPKFSKFDDLEPLDRQDDETAMRSEVEQFSAVDDLDPHADDLKIDVFGPVAVATCAFRASFRFQGEQQSSRIRTTLVFVDTGSGNWLICHEHHSPFASSS
ncbi:nuclear transport factor 2 family protein [Geodermatophilus sp. SYSU D01176]